MTTVSGTTDTSATGATGNATLIGSDFNLFLKMLTTQMQNQDPLDPMDASEYTQQLVQFSQVEQSMQQTTALNNILSSLNNQGMSQAASYIGKEARFDTDIAGLKADSPASWTYASNSKPASLSATIKDMNGKTVATIKLDPADQGRFTWDGTKTDGSKATDGAYQLALTAKDASGNDIDMTINSVGIVREVVTDGSTVMLGVNGLRLSTGGMVGIGLPSAGATSES